MDLKKDTIVILLDGVYGIFRRFIDSTFIAILLILLSPVFVITLTYKKIEHVIAQVKIGFKREQ